MRLLSQFLIYYWLFFVWNFIDDQSHVAKAFANQMRSPLRCRLQSFQHASCIYTGFCYKVSPYINSVSFKLLFVAGNCRFEQSEPITVEVTGAPRVDKYLAKKEINVENGKDATLEVIFCANPKPKQTWHLDSAGTGNKNVILTAGTASGRFVAESVRRADKDDCYISALRINGAHADDSRSYKLSLSNNHGSDEHEIRLTVTGKSNLAKA